MTEAFTSMAQTLNELARHLVHKVFHGAGGESASTFPAEGKSYGSINLDLGKADDKPAAALFDFLKSTLAK